jgi:hypothetical protein
MVWAQSRKFSNGRMSKSADVSLLAPYKGFAERQGGSARHREKFGLVPPQPLAGAARSGSGVSCNARHTGQLLSRARGQRAESRGKVYEGRVWE